MVPSLQTPGATAESLDWLRKLDSGDPCQAQQGWSDFLHSYARILMQVISICEHQPENRQECFVYACEQLCRKRFYRLRQFQVDGPATFATWLRTVVRNLCVDWQRKHAWREGSAAIPVASASHAHSQLCTDQFGESAASALSDSCAAEQIKDTSPGPETLAVKREQIVALGYGLKCLTPKQRLALRLRFQQELTLQEIALVLSLKNAAAADRFLQETIAQLQQTVDSPKFPRKNEAGFRVRNIGNLK